jgi:hypothetical protein
MKRLSDSRTPDSLRHHLDGVEDEDDPDSPLYACPTAYGYAKVGAYSRRDGSMPATPPATLSQNQVPGTVLFMKQPRTLLIRITFMNDRIRVSDLMYLRR